MNCLLTLDRVFETSRRFGFSTRSLGHMNIGFNNTSPLVLLFQQCAPGFVRQESGRFLGQCVACQCNGHSNDCDARTGACLVGVGV